MSDQLPGADQALINPRKLRDYALNAEHHSGRYKAAFFAQMGYTAENWQELECDIRVQHLTQPAEPGQRSAFGRKFTITGARRGPNGVIRQVTTVWLYRVRRDLPELITIEPAARLRRK